VVDANFRFGDLQTPSLRVKSEIDFGYNGGEEKNRNAHVGNRNTVVESITRYGSCTAGNFSTTLCPVLKKKKMLKMVT
jgi:hypothetical protein